MLQVPTVTIYLRAPRLPSYSLFLTLLLNSLGAIKSLSPGQPLGESKLRHIHARIHLLASVCTHVHMPAPTHIHAGTGMQPCTCAHTHTHGHRLHVQILHVHLDVCPHMQHVHIQGEEGVMVAEESPLAMPALQSPHH